MYLVVQNLAVMIIILHRAGGQVTFESEAYSSFSLQEVVPAALATGSRVKEENIIERTILVSHSSSSSSLEEQNNLIAFRRRRLLEEEQDHDEVDYDDEEDNDQDQEDSKRAKPDAIRLHQEIQAAGAEKAKSQFKFIDRFSTERMKQLQKQQQKQQNDDGIKKKKNHHHDVMTDKMKIHTPGTPEFQARQQSLMDHINQHHHRNKNNKSMRQKVPSTNKTVNDLRKGELPFHKDVSSNNNDKDHRNILRIRVAKIPGLHKLIQPKKLSLEEELILDASMTFYTHLETSIYKTQDGKLMTEDEIVALSDWLDLVSIALPPEWHLHKLIDALRDRFEYIAEGMDHMREILQQYRLRKKMWSPECTTDRRGGRLFHVGFDCGMWKLLHIITLGVAEQRGGLNLIESGMMSPSNTKTFSPLEAANAIRNMLQFYYYNNVYGEEFVRQYDDCKNHRRCDRLTDDKEGATIGDWKELALWLWEVHNEITIQVVLKETKIKAASKNRNGVAAVPSSSFGAAAISSIELTHEEQMRAMWPSIEDCYQCFEEDGTWDENEVFYHLEAHYWVGTDVDPKYDRLLRFEGDEEEEESSSSTWAEYMFGVLVCGFLFLVLIRLVRLNSYMINLTVRRAKQYAKFKESKARTV